jgi:hypothetical protein
MVIILISRWYVLPFLIQEFGQAILFPKCTEDEVLRIGQDAEITAFDQICVLAFE